jgi:hypothetical protein
LALRALVLPPCYTRFYSGSLEDELGDVLEKSRDGKGWTQSDLARSSGIKVSEISRMERYEFIPDDAILINLAEVLGLHAPSLIAVAKATWSPPACRARPWALQHSMPGFISGDLSC